VRGSPSIGHYDENTSIVGRHKESWSPIGRYEEISSLIGRRNEISREEMMGYDWIAALLDQSSAPEFSDKHESYFRELKEFRRVNRDECLNETVHNSDG